MCSKYYLSVSCDNCRRVVRRVKISMSRVDHKKIAHLIAKIKRTPIMKTPLFIKRHL